MLTRDVLDPSPESRELLLAEIDDVLRVAPSLRKFTDHHRSDQIIVWAGRAAAAIERWDPTKSARVAVVLGKLPSEYIDPLERAYTTLKILLEQGRADLRLELRRTGVLVPAGQVFEYFDELRRIVETARAEVFFVDPYLDAEFVSRYLPHVAKGVGVRLLCDKKIASLVSAADIFVKQSPMLIAIRSSGGLHVRYVFVDKGCLLLVWSFFQRRCEECSGGRHADH